MSDIELIVKIPEIEYEHLTNQEKFNSLRKSKQEWLINKTLNRIADATPLPKGHGRLIDENELKKEAVRCEWSRNMYDTLDRTLSYMQPIIEADKENN